ncbi:hypothetical protein G210_1447 [Candida maltosa Xu316]|uniref:Uncharacterized protein n=1 Tax=Candida maltosa (strain Xu316) TaxID=1245528 RepID=M3K643_CANMX|nr:hypothetical protein G210_1447 [Candida maltosa Xu316]
MVQQIVASDIESIRNAAQILNSRLTSRAYIDNNILFNCINWKRLVSDQIEELPQLNDLIISEKLYNNDKNTINLIHALLNIIDKQRSHQTIVTETITNKDAKIESLQKQVNQLTKKINDTERETRNKVIKYTSMQSRINELTKQNKSFSDDLNKVKNWTMDTKNKYKVEMKRKNLEIESLQNKLIERSRNIPTAIEYAGGSSNSSDGLMVQNNYPIIENSTGLIINNPDLVADLNIQKEIADSSNKFFQELFCQDEFGIE